MIICFNVLIIKLINVINSFIAYFLGIFIGYIICLYIELILSIIKYKNN